MNKLRRIFNPTKEEKIEDYERRIIEIHKEHYGDCCTCVYYNPPPADLPGCVTDYGECKLNIDIFAEKACGLLDVTCESYEENTKFVEHFTELINKLRGK